MKCNLLFLQAADLASTSRLVKAAIQHCHDARDYPLLNTTINVLSKKHGQLKSAVQGMVELSISWLPEVKEQAGVDRWLELIETLRNVTEGKVVILTGFEMESEIYLSSDFLGNTSSTGNPPSITSS